MILRRKGFKMVVACVMVLCAAASSRAQSPPPSAKHGELAAEPLVDVAKVDPTIVIELRYATDRNITGHPIYPPGTPCLLRKGVAEQLKVAQAWLHERGLGLKIWDAYRPAKAHQVLWDLVKNPEVVAEPAKGGSKHTWGVAVDVTIVDFAGRELPMPTDFDDFTPAAKSDYTGNAPFVVQNLRALKYAMEMAGFEGIRDEWWHYSAKNWRSYAAIPAIGTPTPEPSPSPVDASTATPSPSPSPR